MSHTYVPPIFPDETVYSYVARLHKYWAETNHRATAMRWFGKAPINIDQRLPIGIAHLAEATGNVSESLLQHHTFFPLFSGFVSSPRALEEAMLSNSGNQLANASNVAQAGVKTLGGSRYCPLCLEQDKRHFGVAFWHLSHQMHGVTCCSVHDINLIQVELSPRKFELPPREGETPRVIASNDAVKLTDLLLRFNRDFEFNILDCREDYWGGAAVLLRLKNQFRGQYVDMSVVMDKVNAISEATFGCRILSENVVFNLLHNFEYHCHPTKHIFLNYVLDQLPTVCMEAESRKQEFAEWLKKDRFECVRIYQKDDYSFRSVSRHLGRSVNFVKTVARHMGVKYTKRTKFITPDIEARIIDSAKAGLDRRDIAEREGVSVSSVEQFIQYVPGLSEKRRNIRKEVRREEARGLICRVISDNPDITRNDLKKAFYADYMWLYRHDKDWLYETLPPANNHTKL